MGYLTIGKESHQREIAELLLNQFQLFRVFTKLVSATTQAGVVDTPLDLPFSAFSQVSQHAYHVLACCISIATAEHNGGIIFKVVTDRQEFFIGIDAHEVAYQVITGVRPRYRQTDKDIACHT